MNEPIIAYKGFDAEMKCRGMQYAVGQTYEHKGPVVACKSGFHACEYPLDVLRYYAPSRSVYAVIQQDGKIARHDEDSKIASSHLTVTASIDLAGLIKAAIKYTMDRCTPANGATSDQNNNAVATSGKNKAATASGNYGAATASGNYGAATASGNSGAARGKDGCALFLVYRNSGMKIVHARAFIVGLDGIKPDVFYRLNEDGEVVEVGNGQR